MQLVKLISKLNVPKGVFAAKIEANVTVVYGTSEPTPLQSSKSSGSANVSSCFRCQHTDVAVTGVNDDSNDSSA